MAFTDLTVDNGWIPVQNLTDVLTLDVEESAVEAVARKVNMVSDIATVPRFNATGVDVVAEGGNIPLRTADLDEVTLKAHKWADRFANSSEDREDAVLDAFAAYASAWTSNFHVSLDNAALGVTGTGGPFESVYRAVGSGNRTSTGGALTYDDLVEAFGELETNRRGSLVAIAHPSLKMTLRSLKDSDGNFVVDADGRLGAGIPSIFGHELKFSHGARTSAAFTDNPTGNPLLVVANRRELILGVRLGPEAKVSSEEQWVSDNVELKMRARRGFVLASADAARVIEITAGA